MTPIDGKPLSSLLFYTHNVAKALKPSVDGELAHAIHETLHFALDGDAQDYLIGRSDNHPCGSGSSSPNNERNSGQAGGTSTSTSTRQEDVGEEDGADDVRPGFFATDDEDRPYISFAWEEDNDTLILPHPATVDNPTLTDPCTTSDVDSSVRDAFDVTAKFFFLEGAIDNAYPEEWVLEAMSRFTRATGLETVDTLILAFSDIAKQCPEEKERRIANVAQLWKQLSPRQSLFSMGLSDFSQTSLKLLVDTLQLADCEHEAEASIRTNDEGSNNKSSITSFVQDSIADDTSNGLKEDANNAEQSHVFIPSSPAKAVFSDLPVEGKEASHGYGPGPCRRPRLCTVNLKEQTGVDGTAQCPPPSNGTTKGSLCWDCSLANYCKENNIILVAHSDRTDILPSRTLPTLMKEFSAKLPHPIPAGKKLRPLWIFKYTVLIRDRGVLADKGFLLFARAVDM